MAKFDGVLLASDMDYTLLNSKGELSPESRQAIAYFMENGGYFTIATGRSPQAFEKPRGFLDFNAPVVLLNGAVIYDYEKKKYLYDHCMTDDCLEACQTVADAFPELGILVCCLDAVYAFRMNEVSVAHLDRMGVSDQVVVDRLSDIPLPWVKVIMTQKPEYLQKVAPWFIERYAECFDLVFSSPHLLEMQSNEIDKGKGILKLAQVLGVDKKDVYCAGDQQNDAAMMSAVTSFAPANAVDEIKKMAKYIVSDCDNHAMRDIIEILDKQYK